MEKKRKRNYAKKRRRIPPHRRNNLSASVSRPRERLCMIYSRIRRNTRRGRAVRERERERERKREKRRTRARDAGEQVERRGVESDSLSEDRINRVHEVSEEVTWLLREQLPLVICLLLSQFLSPSSCRSFCCISSLSSATMEMDVLDASR
ncbi:hypothetical protein ALC60_06591 [Trachymyrmex zeteki]|uniref:Uncharacterized protein n=1 Tax=Mycetomoellerius zeteki TaxID=64791 RepID=A0A151X2N6_9HYME|nr:hypothetical protein ALC60_06591 [Trachymyrmex zeteki]